MDKMFLNLIFKNSKDLLKSHNYVFNSLSNNSFRSYVTRKRFYKNCGILKSEGKYEITLDQRKLKTPRGTLFTVESEPLALAVATEWNSQKNNINRSQMHLTTLCNTQIDNPNNLNKYDMATYIADYLDTDTLLFQGNEDKDLLNFQEAEWDPIIEWFNKRYSVNIEKSQQMDKPPSSEQDKAKITKHLLSYNFSAMNGIVYAVDTLKSVILTLACVERSITPEKAVFLSRLEEEYQTKHWGRVEWAHDLAQQDLQARLSAAILFIYCNSQSSNTQKKTVQQNI